MSAFEIELLGEATLLPEPVPGHEISVLEWRLSYTNLPKPENLTLEMAHTGRCIVPLGQHVRYLFDHGKRNTNNQDEPCDLCMIDDTDHNSQVHAAGNHAYGYCDVPSACSHPNVAEQRHTPLDSQSLEQESLSNPPVEQRSYSHLDPQVEEQISVSWQAPDGCDHYTPYLHKLETEEYPVSSQRSSEYHP